MGESCSFRKIVKKPDALLNNYHIKGLDGVLLENANGYVKQKPNRRILGINFLRVYVGIYTMFETKKHRLWQEKIKNNLGEAPVIYDSTLTKLSSVQIKNYLFGKGYFDAKVSDSVRIKHRKANVYYQVQKGLPYTIRNLYYIIPDTALERIYLNDYFNTFLIRNENFDEEKQIEERNRISASFKNNGYYYFNREYIFFDIDSNTQSHQLDIYTRIINPETNTLHKPYKLSSIFVSIDTNGFRGEDTTKRDFIFSDFKKKLRGKILKEKIFLKSGDLFNQHNLDLTYSRISDLGVFRLIDIQFKESVSDSNKLNCMIMLSSAKKQELRGGVESFLSSENVGAAGNLTLRNKNLFRGAEFFEFRLKGGLETQTFLNNNDNAELFNTQLFDASLNLGFPKFIFPYSLNTSEKYGSPRTKISTNFTYDQRPDYFRKTFSSSLSYEWKETIFKSHIFTPIDINFVNAILSTSAKDKIIASNNRFLLESFNPHISAGGRYIFTYNSQEVNKVKNFNYLRFSVELAGNTLYGLSKLAKLDKDSSGIYKIIGLQFYNYLRPEVDYRYYYAINRDNTLVFRFYNGFGLSYLNSEILPFEKQFFIGGSNSIRAWRARTIGPGTFSNINRGTGETILNIDQTGDLKLEGNLELRFLIFDHFLGAKLRGALFTDYGNIWEIKDKNSAAGTVFTIQNFYNELAIGSGMGLRFDYGFFIFRLDAALKVKDPQFNAEDRWVIRKLYNDTWKQANGNYEFLNFNFGIGYPF